MLRLALPLCLIANAAAACPTANDMAQGILFTLNDGGTELHKRTSPDRVKVFATFQDGEASMMDVHKGLYLLSSMPVENGLPVMSKLESYSTEAEIAQWDAPIPNSTWTNASSSGGTAKSGGVGKTTFGDCAYDSFDIELSFADDPNYGETYTYFPALGTSILVETHDPERTDRYVYVSIKAAAK